MNWNPARKRAVRLRPFAHKAPPSPPVALKRRKRAHVSRLLAVCLVVPLLRMLHKLPASRTYLALPGELAAYAPLPTPVGDARNNGSIRLASRARAAGDSAFLEEELHVAPRVTRHTTVASGFAPGRRHAPRLKRLIRAVFVCHYSNPCCIATLKPGLRALVRQTVMPDALTIIHACEMDDERRLLHKAVSAAVKGEEAADSSPHLSLSSTDHVCKGGAASASRYDACILRHLASTRGPIPTPFTVVLSDREVFEPTAVEKSWLYLSLHPDVYSVQTLAYDERTLQVSIDKQDPLLIKRELPLWNHSLARGFSSLPLVYRSDEFSTSDGVSQESERLTGEGVERLWEPLIRTLSNARLLREALFTRISHTAGVDDLRHNQPMLFLPHAPMPRRHIPPQLFSDLAFYKWSARLEESEMYGKTFTHVNDARIDIDQLSVPPVRNEDNVKRIMFVMPCMQMGGSEKAMLDLADRVLSMNWAVTFVLTMPDWHEDDLGEMTPENAWLDRALALTSDVVNLASLAPNHLTSKVFRYILETRRPDIVFNSNARWAYGHSSLIRAVVPNAIVADYNHMIHKQWFGGGLPRYGANNSQYFDVHFTASRNVADPMEEWIDSKLMQQNPNKVKPCYIGTDPALFYTGAERATVRTNMRSRLNISEGAVVVLFAGRFVAGKGIDVMSDLIKKAAGDAWMAPQLFFAFVGDGAERHVIESIERKHKNVLVMAPARSLNQMREYYAMSDVLLLPSVNEGIALVLYEAMAAELLVIATDVGGQRELVTPGTGVLVQNSPTVSPVTKSIMGTLRDVLHYPEKYESMRKAAREKVRASFTTSKFCDCILKGLQEVEQKRATLTRPSNPTSFDELSRELVEEVRLERSDGIWKRQAVARSLERALTIGIKTYVCDGQTFEQVRALIRSIRVNYPHVRVLLGNDGPSSLRDEPFVTDDDYTEEIRLERDSGISAGRNALVNLTTTKYFVLLDDDHVIDDSTNLVRVVQALEKGRFDIVGLRVRNLPGIVELERERISIPRYVSRIEKFEDRRLQLCTWNENDGPSVFGMQEAIKVDVLHNAFLGRTDALRRRPWRDELQVNEHMTFFLDAWRAKLNVGYLPSEFVHHRAREYSQCYYSTRFREDRFRSLLDYEDRFLYNVACGRAFPDEVRRHVGNEEYGS